MELNPEINERLKAIVELPHLADSNDAHLLEEFSEQYPYFKAVHLLRLKTSNDPEILTRAAVYSNGTISYRFNQHLSAPALQEDQLSVPAEKDEQETFDEIGEFDLAAFTAQEAQNDQKDAENPVETPAAENFFVPETNAGETVEEPVNEFPEIETVTPDEPEHADLSKYDDDKLPYTFLWWLAKTRAEHRQIFQPYAAPKNPGQDAPKPQGPLQQQYVEHIFHLQTGVEDVEQDLEGNISEHAAKDQEIINAFLESDPQIKPPPVNKLDNENKARKSAEDHNDVVSETLAAIYIEQMLYRKAIDTYEKLSLKFPEKSRYFADLIKSLEKKI